MTFFDPPGSIEQTAYPLPHCQQGEVAGIIIFCLAYQFMLLSLTNPEKVVGLENVTDLKKSRISKKYLRSEKNSSHTYE